MLNGKKGMKKDERVRTNIRDVNHFTLSTSI